MPNLEASVASAIAAAGLAPGSFYEWPEDLPQGKVYVSTPNDHSFYWAVPAGQSYAPDRKPHRHTLEIVVGAGVITHNEVMKPYKKGDVIEIMAGDTYGLTRVDEATVVLRGPSDVPGLRGD